MLQLLHAEGPLTASDLARRLGESSGATSYHLRALHRAGMVEDERRNRRERWWKRVGERTLVPTSIDPGTPDEERALLQAAHSKLESVLLDRDDHALSRWQQIRYAVPIDWQDASFIGNFKVWGTAAEIRALVATILDATEPYRAAPRDAETERRAVHFTLRVLIQEEREPTG